MIKLNILYKKVIVNILGGPKIRIHKRIVLLSQSKGTNPNFQLISSMTFRNHVSCNKKI